MEILQTPTFKKQLKKLNKNQKIEVDAAIRKIAASPSIGEAKKGDLRGIQVYKFKMIKQLTLLAYKYQPAESQIVLLALNTHENFYRDLKKALN